MPKFSEQIAGIKKQNNHRKSRGAKAVLRREVMSEIGQVRVFDAFAGAGRMHRDVWRNAAQYVGCDLRWYRDERMAYAADNRRVLRAIDLSAFNVFDLDAYGSPWEQVLIIAARRQVEPGERIGLCLTDGSGLKLKMGQLPTALTEIAQMTGHPAGVAQLHGEIIERAIAGLARRMQCEVVARWEAQGKTAAAVRYVGLVLRGVD